MHSIPFFSAWESPPRRLGHTVTDLASFVDEARDSHRIASVRAESSLTGRLFQQHSRRVGRRRTMSNAIVNPLASAQPPSH